MTPLHKDVRERAWTPVLAHSTKVFCSAWHARDGSPVIAATCRICERDVAHPVESAKDTPVCIYCGLDDGSLALIDVPLGEPLILTTTTAGERDGN